MTNLSKSVEKIEAIKETQVATEAAMQAVIDYLKSSDQPSSEVAHEIIDSVLAEHNCESPEGHIVASGKQSAEPHEHGRGLIGKGEPVVIDIFPRSKDTEYFADMSRTVCVGKPSSELQKMYDTVLAVQEMAISMVKPGVKCVDIQVAAENFFQEAGFETSGVGKEFKYAEGFVHSIGHGVGKDIHEEPFLTKKSDLVLKEGDVITIEPGLYYKDIGGIRLEDLILVTADGYENLTNFPKKLNIGQQKN